MGRDALSCWIRSRAERWWGVSASGVGDKTIDGLAADTGSRCVDFETIPEGVAGPPFCTETESKLFCFDRLALIRYSSAAICSRRETRTLLVFIGSSCVAALVFRDGPASPLACASFSFNPVSKASNPSLSLELDAKVSFEPDRPFPVRLKAARGFDFPRASDLRLRNRYFLLDALISFPMDARSVSEVLSGPAKPFTGP